MRFSIIGSGFGFYGYLPALAEKKENIIFIPEGYRSTLNQRKELTPYKESISFLPSIEACLDQCEALVVASIPSLQTSIVDEALKRKNINTLFLEKPLSRTPLESIDLLERLIESHKKFRINYSFFYSCWWDDLRTLLEENKASKVVIDWKFNAYHFSNNLKNWKRYHQDGGGVLRFYGIHLIAVLARMGYKVSTSLLESENEGEPHSWYASFYSKNFPNVEINLSTTSLVKEFSVKTLVQGVSKVVLNLENPFQKEEVIQNQDIRVSLLKGFIKSQDVSSCLFEKWYSQVNALWLDIETLTETK